MGWNVYVTRRLPQSAMDIVEANCDIMDVNPEDRILSREELLSNVKGRDGILCLLTDTIDEELLSAAESAKIFANYAVGFDNIDVEAATRQKVIVTNTPGVLTETTSDMAWALLFSIARRIVEADRFTRAGKFSGWGPMMFLGNDVTGKTLGVIGCGRVGESMALKSKGFRMNVLYSDVVGNETLEKELGAKRVELDELLSQSDFISTHVLLSPQTTHLIGEREFGLMKKTAYLINTSRGPVIDEAALVKALKDGEIAGAALDVFENEPELKPGLADLDNVVIVPHIASATVETRTKMAVMAAENLIAGLEGRRPPNIVNPEVLD